MVAFNITAVEETLKLIGAGELSSFEFKVHVGEKFTAECNLEETEADTLKSQTGVYPLCGIQTVGITYTDENGDEQTNHVGYADTAGIAEVVREIYVHVYRLWPM